MLQCFAVDPVRVLSCITYRVRNVIPLHALDVSIVKYAPFGLIRHLFNVPDELRELVNQFLPCALDIAFELVPFLSVGLEPVRIVCVRQSV